MTLVDIYARRNHFSKSIEHLKDILLPYQEKLEDEIETAIKSILHFSEGGEMNDAQMKVSLLDIVEKVKKAHYMYDCQPDVWLF